MLTYGSAWGLPTVGCPPMFFQQWRAWHIPTLTNKTCRIVNPLTSIILLWTLEPGIYFTGSLFPAHTRERISKRLTCHQLCAPPTRCGTNRAPAICSPYPFPEYIFLDLPLDVICSNTQFRLCVHTLCNETATSSWNQCSGYV